MQPAEEKYLEYLEYQVTQVKAHMEAIGEPRDVSTMAATIGMTEKAVEVALSTLMARGLVVQQEEDKYALIPLYDYREAIAAYDAKVASGAIDFAAGEGHPVIPGAADTARKFGEWLTGHAPPGVPETETTLYPHG